MKKIIEEAVHARRKYSPSAWQFTENWSAPHAPKQFFKGDIIYYCKRPDYGLARDDERAFGEEFYSMTLNEDGDYPSFTVPVRVLERIWY